MALRFLLPGIILVAAIAPVLAQRFNSYSRKSAAPQPAELIRKRAEWFFRQRATQNGHIPGHLLLDAFAANRKMIEERGTFLQPHLSPAASARKTTTSNAITSQLNTWTPLGPQPTAATQFYGNVSGRVTALAVDTCDATGNTVYAGAADGGVWVSFNALNGNPVTWQPLTDSQTSLSTGAIAINPASCGTFNSHAQSNLILVGTGESNFAQDNIYGAGVLRSTDGGQTWTQDATFTAAASQSAAASGPYIAALAVQPNVASPIILAAVQGTDFSAAGALHSGVYTSSDSGAHWSRVQPGSAGPNAAPFNPATDVIFDPSDPTGKIAYAALGDPLGDADPNASCPSAPCNGVYVSNTAGRSWNRVTGIDATSTASSFGRISLALAPGASPSASELYVSIADATTASDNLLAVLSGTSIAPNGSGPAFNTIFPNTSNLPDFCEPLCYYSMKLAAVPGTSGSVVFAGGSAQPHFTGAAYGMASIYRSSDGGATWQDFSADNSGNNTYAHVDIHALAFALGSSQQVLAMFDANDGGVWTSTDVFNPATTTGNQHWLDLNTITGTADTSLNITQFYPGVALHPTTDQILYGGTQGNDVQEFSGSLSWSGAEACPYDGGYTAVDQQNPSTVYAACAYLGGPGTLNKNTQGGIPGNDGINWAAIDFQNGIDFSDNADFIPPFVLDPVNSQNLYFGTFRLYQSLNAGGNWSAITSDLTTDSTKNFITTIAVAPSDSNTLYVGTSDGLIWQSSQALSGATDIHDVKQNTQPSRQVSAIGIDSLVPPSAFVAYSGFSCPGVSGCDGLGHLFFTSNSGAAWIKVDGNLPDVPVNDLAIDPEDPTDSTIYIATDSGVYASSNATAGSATTWTILQTGLPNVQVLSLKLNAASRTLVAATHGRGVWNIKLPTVSKSITLTSLNPVSANAGDPAFLLTATGTNFTAQSAINFNGANLATTFVSATSLTATVPTSDVSCAGPLFVSVTDPVAGSTSPLRFTVGGGCDFSFGPVTPASQTLTPGATATFNFTLNTTGSGANPVQLSCPTAPVGFTCQFSVNPATPTQAGTAVMLTLSIPASAALPPTHIPSPGRFVGLFLATLLGALFALQMAAAGANKKSAQLRLRGAFSLLAIIFIVGLMAACGGGGGGGGGNPPRTYTIGIQGVAQPFQHLTDAQVVVD
ncbi:MAG TPA: IPT/TIG domain-containing protein [Candidatus Acidoferrales bacterium]